MHAPLPLAGRTALVTGVSRRRGIGYAVATKLAELGASIVVHHFRPHDLDQPWGGDDLDAVRAGIRSSLTPGAAMDDLNADLADPAEPARVIEAARGLTGDLDLLVCNHARSGGDGGILDMTPERLDAFWDVNTRSTLLLTAAFARAKRPAARAGARSERRADASTAALRPGERIHRDAPFTEPQGRVIWMTSGQVHGPMRGEVAYATSKAALAGVTATVAAELLDLGILLTTIDPGPVNTGYLDPETADRPLEGLEAHLATTPFGRVGRPTDVAELIGWLATPSGAWNTGQVITSDGGFSLR
ncbi:SDR family oxidoreductase [Agromyces sp. GXS1127]|uniref:SDR family oxidoreductase n=1 Tax=Agromyces sp. GXS1127 TaxID=3424181 RepID=UPI003D31E02E